jgi:hypothetical protein
MRSVEGAKPNDSASTCDLDARLHPFVAGGGLRRLRHIDHGRRQLRWFHGVDLWQPDDISRRSVSEHGGVDLDQHLDGFDLLRHRC